MSFFFQYKPNLDHNQSLWGSVWLTLTHTHRILVLTGCLIVVDVDSVQLKSRVTHIVSCRVDAMLIADHFPKLTESQQKHKKTREERTWDKAGVTPSLTFELLMGPNSLFTKPFHVQIAGKSAPKRHCCGYEAQYWNTENSVILLKVKTVRVHTGTANWNSRETFLTFLSITAALSSVSNQEEGRFRFFTFFQKHRIHNYSWWLAGSGISFSISKQHRPSIHPSIHPSMPADMGERCTHKLYVNIKVASVTSPRFEAQGELLHHHHLDNDNFSLRSQLIQCFLYINLGVPKRIGISKS